MVMEVMESLEPSQVGEAREVIAAMVLPVVREGEIVVAGIQPEDQKSGDPSRKHDPKHPPDCQGPGHDDEEWCAGERFGLGVVLRVTTLG
jgi:hypothetical protein